MAITIKVQTCLSIHRFRELEPAIPGSRLPGNRLSGFLGPGASSSTGLFIVRQASRDEQAKSFVQRSGSCS